MNYSWVIPRVVSSFMPLGGQPDSIVYW